jgi:hypothetical protein
VTVLPGQRLCRLPAGGNYGLVFFVTSSSVTFITAPVPLNTRLSDQCRKHRYQDSSENPSEGAGDHGRRHSQFTVCKRIGRCSVTCVLFDRTHNACGSQVVPNPAGRPMAGRSAGSRHGRLITRVAKVGGGERSGARQRRSGSPSLSGSNAK